jgi:5-hydroxyisourate hydrolase-like protein (transthyretin family)
VYRLVFETGKYFKSNGIEEYFFPEVTVTFKTKIGQHYHGKILVVAF